MQDEKSYPSKGKTKPKPLSTWTIGWIGLGTVIVLLIPLWIYMFHLAKNGISGKPEQWAQFGDFFGGVLSPIVALLTLVVTIVIAVRLYKIEKNYHHDEVKPYFTIAHREFFSADLSALPPTIDADDYSYEPPQHPIANQYNFDKSFYFRMSNKGLGVATEVVVTFELNLKELKILLPINNENIVLTISDIKIDEEEKREFMIINIDSAYFNHHGWMKVLAKEKSGYGTIDKNKKFKISVPNQIITLFNLYNIKRKSGQPIDDFPTILLSFDYKNIHGISLCSKFRVGLFHIQDFATFSRFKLLAEPII